MTPRKSVKNPGINKKIPPPNKRKLLSISTPGLCVLSIDCLACVNDDIPWYFIVNIPKNAVNKVNKIDDNAPISVPICTKK